MASRARKREADRLLLTRFVPAAVVVSEQLDVIQTRGRVERYLGVPSGKATLNLRKVVKSGLLFELQRILEEAKETGEAVRRDNVPVEIDGGVGAVTIELVPFRPPLQSQTSYLIVFEEGRAAGQESPPRPAVPPDAKDRQIAQLKRELDANKEYLQSIIEALETSNEELQSVNEEIQSGNEELQSANKELQTSREELESANQEMNKFNDEMRRRNLELTQLNNDLLDLLASARIPIVMLDADLSIRRITSQTEEVLGIFPSDIGRPLRHVRMKLHVPALERLMLEVIEKLQPHELLAKDGQNRPCRLRITPYCTMDNRIEGVVLVVLDTALARVPPDASRDATPRRQASTRDRTVDTGPRRVPRA